MAEPKLRFGIVGIGAGARGLLRGFKQHPNIELVAVCDVRQEALDRFAKEYGGETYTNVEDIASSPNIDAIWVATPNQYHAQHVITVAEHKKHVIVSKPMATTLDECKQMIDAADRNGVKLLAGHTQSVMPGVRKMADLVRSGDYGPLGMVHSWNYTPWIYRPRMPEELDQSKGGGVVYRQSPHHIDIVRLIAGGMVRSVRAMTKIMDPERPVPGIFVAYLEFENDVPCTLVYSGYGHFDSGEITFSRGQSPGDILIQQGMTREQEEALKEGRRFTAASRETPALGGGEGGGDGLSAFGLTIASCAKADIRQSPNGVYVYKEFGKPEEIELPRGYARGYDELNEMYEGVVHDKPIVHDGRWGLATQEVTMAIIQSAAEHREIRMQYQVPYPG